ncbi:hypothetical protein [Salinilacihabitans rarus]|uniref:hypothetical protein n=1 Tax=Salinilacihabitans rarus TaxID=2961596 RepID=UPI0020C8B79F|nr:hypothetical protein [Salinilacihabitans rarus]
MPSAQEVLDRYADGTPYESLAAAFREFERPPGDDPVLLVAEAAAATTGQNYVTGVRPTVERFREAFVETGRATTLEALAALSVEDETLVEAFGAQRKRRVLLEVARALAARSETGLDALRAWAVGADPYRYEADPIGSISGVGPSTFQFLRQQAGVDAATPDPTLTSLVERVDDEVEGLDLDTSESLRTIASCELLSLVTSYRILEIDRIAWWTFTDEDEREAEMALGR